MIVPFTTGFAISFALILAIGAQNAFILRHGLMRQHVFWICLFAGTSDALLIAAGVLGFHKIAEILPWFPTLMLIGGALFLIYYGYTRFSDAWRGDYEMVLAGAAEPLAKTLAILAAFTWLNPHVYLDTVGLIGANALQYSDYTQRLVFGAGAMSASYVFFFSLGYGARLLSPIMQSSRAWQRLDVGIGLLMWVLAAKLIQSALAGH